MKSGSSPLIGAHVSLLRTGGSSPGVLASATTDSNGDFILGFKKPAANAILYLIAAGGGVTPGQQNTAIKLLAVLGVASAAPAHAVVNELTTVASVWSLARFLTATGVLAGPSPGLPNATLTVANLVDVNAGVLSPFLATGVNTPRKLDTLADILAACVSSDGSSSPQCSQLFVLSSSEKGALRKDTLAAAWEIARNPARNSSSLFGLRPASVPFMPVLSGPPGDWTIGLNYTGIGLQRPTAVAVDKPGNVWIADDAGVVVKLAPNGSPLSGSSGFSDGGLDHCFGIAIDALGNAWVSNKYANTTNGSVTKLSPNGAPLSGSLGFRSGGIDYPLAIAGDSAGNIWVANFGNSTVTRIPAQNPSRAINFKNGGFSFPVGIAAGAKTNSNIWVANQGNDSASEIRVRRSIPSSAAAFKGGGLDSPSAIAVDSAGNAWVTNFYGQSVTALTPAGVPISGSPFTEGALDGPAAIAVDGAGDIWVANFHGASVTVLAGAPQASTGTPVSGPSGYGEAGLDGPSGIAVDSAGNVWVANFNNSSVTEFVGAAAPVKTPLR